MSRYTYSIEIEFGDLWVLTAGLTHCPRGYLLGYLDCMREVPGPRVGHRLVRSDGKVLDTAPGLTEVSIGMVAGFPTAEQYERAGQAALEQARLIREREAARKSRRGEP